MTNTVSKSKDVNEFEEVDKEFDEKFGQWEAADDWDYSELRYMSNCNFYNPIKDFIHLKLAEAEKRGEEKGYEKGFKDGQQDGYQCAYSGGKATIEA